MSKLRTLLRNPEYATGPSYQLKQIGGRQALALVAEFVQGKTVMAEYLVWVLTDRSLAEFSVRCPAGELDAVRNDVEPVVESVRMP